MQHVLIMNEATLQGRTQACCVEDKCLAKQTHIQAVGLLSMFSDVKQYLLIDQYVAVRSERIESIAQRERPCHVLPSARCCFY